MKQGLNLYDYGARYYDPASCRFTTMDPMAEMYYSISPYAYCANNPLNAVDPSGMAIDWYGLDEFTGVLKKNVSTSGFFFNQYAKAYPSTNAIFLTVDK